MTPQQQYIITFEELQELKPDVADGMYRSTKEMNQEKTIFRVLSRPAPLLSNEDEYEIKGYVTFSKSERDKIIAFLSQPFSKEVLSEMRDVVRKHEQSLRTEAHQEQAP